MTAATTNYPDGNFGGIVGESDLVTGEAVALDLPPAALGMRALSGLIDVTLTIAILGTVMSMLIAVLSSWLDEATTAAVTVIATVAMFVAFPTAFEAATGRTLAKMMLGLRTLRDDGGPITFRHALTRHLVGFVEIYGLFAAPALVCGLLNPRSKRLGDLAAGTYVVRDRMKAPWPKLGVVPAPLAAWAASADIGPLPDHLALSIRELLARATQIRPEARLRLAHALAQQASAYVAPGPPLGTPPEAFLEGLLVERGRRDWLRLQREEQLRRRLIGNARPGLTPLAAPFRG